LLSFGFKANADRCGDALDKITVRPGSPRGSGSWSERLGQNARTSRRAGSDAEIVFYGDSITEDLAESREAVEIFDKKLNTIVLGIGGDETGNLLYRLQNGEWDPMFKPKIVSLLIGTNNVRHAAGDDSSEKSSSEGYNGQPREVWDEVFQDVEQIAAYIHSKDCDTQIVVQAILPLAEDVRNEWPNRYTESVVRTNRLLRDFASEYAFMHFIDCGDLFLEDYAGRQRINEDLMGDLLHPNDRGHMLLGRCVLNEMERLMPAAFSGGEQPVPPPHPPAHAGPVYLAPRVDYIADLPRAFWPDWFKGLDYSRSSSSDGQSSVIPEWWRTESAPRTGRNLPGWTRRLLKKLE